ncbi:MAG TPA: ISKra4 family transposase [Gemmataceae bacterium]|nr:ISKra4 family transposase [Gemmataceae bacterium]
MSCPHCQEAARFVDYRPKTVQSLVGTFSLKRAYYHCPSCGAGAIPWDEALGLSRQALTPGARELVCIAGAVDSFAEAADVVLRKLSGLRVSESTAERTSEATGDDIGQRLAAGETFGASQPWAWHKDAEGKTCAYVSLDLTGLGMQGPHGAAAEGRMAAVGMIYNPVPEDAGQWAQPQKRAPQFQARYVAGLEGQASLAEPLRKQAAQVGMDQAQRWIALSDAGSGVEDFLRVNFGRVEAVIVDFYHVAEYLGELGRALYPSDESTRAEWIEQWCHRLKHEGGTVVLEALRALDLPGREAVRTVYDEVLTYFENQVHRMDYPTYQAKGWAIGSGPIEAACKTVIGKRMKGGGMRWGEDGADGMCHLRALFASGEKQWDAYWHPRRN